MDNLEAKFLELYNLGRESDAHDYKKEFNMGKKGEKYNLIKDFMAFANFGGGYILIGVAKDKDKPFYLNSISTELDPAEIGNNIEHNVSKNIKFDIKYFTIEDSEKHYKVGIVYIYPSDIVLFFPDNCNDENNRTIIQKNDVYTRRNTQSIKANPEEIMIISERIKNQKNLYNYYASLKSLYEESLMNEQAMRLCDIYIEPNIEFWEKSYKKEKETTLDAYEGFLSDERYETISLFVNDFLENKLPNDFVQNARLLVILGQPGQGKTSFCKKLLHSLLSKGDVNLIEKNICYIRLSEINNRELINTPLKVLYDKVKTSFCEGQFEQSILILDGLDELTINEQGRVGVNIDTLVRNLVTEISDSKYNNIKVILTSRYGYTDFKKIENIQNMLVCQIKGFSEQQQLDWLLKYKNFNSNTQLTEDKIRNINSTANPVSKHFRELLQQPILLHSIAKLNIDIDTTQNVKKVYDVIFDVIANRWWDNMHQTRPLEGLTSKILRDYIREVAFVIYNSENDNIPKAELKENAKTLEFKRCISNAGEDDVKNLMISFFMKESKKTLDGDYAIEFLHKSVQEYLVAEKIWEDIKQLQIGDGWQPVLDTLGNLFKKGMKPESNIPNYLQQVIQADISEKKHTVNCLKSFLNYFLDCHFLPKEMAQTTPITTSINIFHGYWLIISGLFSDKDKQDIIDESNQENFIYMVKCLGTLANKKEIDLSGMRFLDIDLSKINLINSNLTNVVLGNSALIMVDFSESDLSNSDLSHSNITGSSFFGAVLKTANLSNCDLKDVIFDGADLSFANLEGGKNLKFIQLQKAKSLYKTEGLSDKIKRKLSQPSYRHLLSPP